MEALERPSWNPARQCTAMNRAGERCRRQPIPGGSVCVNHGGAIPNVKQAAKLRLVAMVEPILTTFEEILAAWHRVTCTGCGHVDENGVKCVGCGKPTGDPTPVIRVGQLVLDRAGFHPRLELQVEPPGEDLSDLSIEELADRAEAMARLARDAADAEATRMLPVATDGVLIDDGFEVPDADAPEGAEHAADVPIPSEIDTPEKWTPDISKENSDE